MQSDNRFFDDAAKLAGGAIGTLAGLRREVEALARQQVERLLERMDLVTRDEFEAVKEMAAKARAEQDDLAARLAVLEAKAAPKPRAKSGKPKSKPRSGDATS
jgi:BMFP domain-containing protein YqiC